MYLFIISFIPIILIINTTYDTLPYVFIIFHYCLVFQATIESSINVHVNDGRIYISLVSDGTLKSIYQRRALHYSSMTIVMSVIVHLFFTRYLSFSPRSTVSTQRYLVILIHKR